MKEICFDEGWEFRRGFVDSAVMINDEDRVVVNLPHDGMISLETSPEAPAKHDSGYYFGDTCNYTKYFFFPKEWEGEKIGLKFDGVMMHAMIDVNGSKVAAHHYGYSPFYVDLTDYVVCGAKNRITLNINTGVQPSSRWYSGSGLFRSVTLCCSPKVHVKQDGVYIFTKEVTDNEAFLEAEIDVCNESLENRLAEVHISLIEEKSGEEKASSTRIIQVNKCKEETARMAFTLSNPVLWDVDSPNLYVAKVSVKDVGVFKTHLERNEVVSVDETETLFGVRTVTADAVRGLRINGKTVKLKGGCVHHDNGLLGAVSLYESEVRKVLKLKEVGFNAIRTAHNPPSKALVEACDRVGMYIFDEAFDAWGMSKRAGDFATYFEYIGEEELKAFVKRDRVHPSVIMWSTGNEIPERGGLGNGYTIAAKLAETMRKLDKSRPISNGICSFWSGLDDTLSQGQNSGQNAKNNEEFISWDRITEPFTNGLDIVGYNYMEEGYEKSHSLFPDRVILGSENFPKEIGFRWPLVEKLPYVIGDFTWTAWDYIGEAGLGKSAFVDPDDRLVKEGPGALMPFSTSPYPWRLANDADFDITGNMRPQGAYRSVVWGSEKTFLFAQKPENYGKTEVISLWGFTDVEKNWNFKNSVDKPIEVVAFSKADEVALILNGKEIDRKPVSQERPLPNSVRFQLTYVPGKLEAVSFKDGKEVSRDFLETTGTAEKLLLQPEKETLKADGHDVVYVKITVADKAGNTVTDASVDLTASVEGAGMLAGFGTANPITKDVYSDNKTVSFYGEATAVIRSGYEGGKTVLKVSSDALGISEECELVIE